jgi:hypothetical protein
MTLQQQTKITYNQKNNMIHSTALEGLKEPQDGSSKRKNCQRRRW